MLYRELRSLFGSKPASFTGACYKGHKKSGDGGCDECPVNTYTDHTHVLGTNTECTPCPDDKVSPPGSTSLDDCQKQGRNFMIMTFDNFKKFC